MAQGASPRLLVFLTALFPISRDLRPGPQRGEIYKWHQSAECERAGRCPVLRTALWLKHIQGPPAPEAGDLGHYPGYSWGTVGVRVGYG